MSDLSRLATLQRIWWRALIDLLIGVARRRGSSTHFAPTFAGLVTVRRCGRLPLSALRSGSRLLSAVWTPRAGRACCRSCAAPRHARWPPCHPRTWAATEPPPPTVPGAGWTVVVSCGGGDVLGHGAPPLARALLAVLRGAARRPPAVRARARTRATAVAGRGGGEPLRADHGQPRQRRQ
jgi:hypothetical protein